MNGRRRPFETQPCDQGATRVFTLAVTRALLVRPTTECQGAPSGPYPGRTDPPAENLAMSTALPYPPLPKAKRATTGVTLTAQQLADETGITLERATRLLTVAATLVTEYAPEAPGAVSDEAVIRFAGYLGQSDYGTVRSESLGP